MERFGFSLKCLEFVLLILNFKPTQQQEEPYGLYHGAGQKQGNFLQHPNKILSCTSKIISRKTCNAMSCAHACLRNARCFSFNVAILPDADDKYECVLLSADTYNSFINLLPSKEFNHFSVLSPCEFFPCQNGGRCIPDSYENLHYKCDCAAGFAGTHCKKVVRSCQDLMEVGVTEDGVYTIRPDEQGAALKVYCDQSTDGGGWTVLQRRVSPFDTSFNRNWEEYRTGFGNLTGEFWLGNDNIHRLAAAPVSFRIEFQENEGNKLHARYENFTVAGADDKYRWDMDSYSGDLSNAIYGSTRAMFRETGNQFSTPDSDNDRSTPSNCAAVRSSGWWYNHCGLASLNHIQGPKWAQSLQSSHNWMWASFSEMKVRFSSGNS